jgi:hypothetical protein
VFVDLWLVSMSAHWRKERRETYEGAPFLMYGDQAEGTWTAAHLAPVVLIRLRGAQMAI